MLAVLLYFFLNFAGFFVFLAIWNWLPKPKPFDYTTIPGLKLNVSSAEEIPDLVKKPGKALNLQFKGHINEVRRHENLREFLDFMFLTYGPLSSFWWSDRYSVVVSSENLIAELKKFSASLLAISAFSTGSYLNSHQKFCTTIEFQTRRKSQKRRGGLDLELTEDVQNSMIFDENFDFECREQTGSPSSVDDNLRHQYPSFSRKSLCRPLLAVFDEEIWVDAHPIPKFVPILIHTEEICRNWHDDELFPKFYAQFYWLPGFSKLTDSL